MSGFNISGDAIFGRKGANEISKNLFALLVSLFTAIGVGSSAVAAYYCQKLVLTWPILIGVLVIGIVGILIAHRSDNVGILIAHRSDNPAVSLIGLLMVAIPLGCITGPVVALYTPVSVFTIFLVTTAMVVVLGLVGAVIPDNLESWGSWLLGALLVLLVGYFIIPLSSFVGMPMTQALNIWDWIGVAIFAFLIVYDWNRAMRVPRTVDNAVDCGLAIYLDFINIFIRLLRLYAQKK